MQIRNELYISKLSILRRVFLGIVWMVAAYSSAQTGSMDSITASPPDTVFSSAGNQNTLFVDSLAATIDSIKPPAKKDYIDAEIVYEAQDSIVLFGNGTAYLHGSGDVKYKDMGLKSNYIRVKMDSSIIYARGTVDSMGISTGDPVFTDKTDEYESKEMTYNLKTKKGFIKHAVTQQGEGYIISEKTKKTEYDLLCMADGKYTTCDNHDHPHFYLALTKAKVKPGDYIATGPAYLVVGDVPLPLAVPFGFFPFTNKYSSGIVMPSYGDDFTRGFYLRNGGYYFAINDYLDLELTGDIYTKGTWALNATTNYVKRYKFRGNFNFSYRTDITGEKDMPDYSKATNMSIQWSHSQDAKANPYRTFSASVNFSTSGYNRSNINSYYNGQLNSENTKSSSVSFSQRFPDSPWSLSGSMLVSQRTKDSTISLTLPNITVTMSSIYPFRRKVSVGKERWYEKIKLSYSGSFSNSIDTKESQLLQSSFTRDWKNGIKHSITPSMSFTVFKYLNITPSVSYNERWYFRRTNQSWNEQEQTVQADTTNGFYRVYDFSAGLSMSTKLYGFYIPIRKIFGDKIDRVRHVLTPSVSFNWHPDYGNKFFGYYGEYAKPVVSSITGDTVMENVTYSRYANSLYGTPSQGKSGNISFSLGNNLEMKVRNDKDTTGNNPFKVISLIDNFSISGGYNLIADSMNWSNFSANLRIKLPLNYTLSLSGQFDPYMYGLTASGNPVRINKLRWNNGKFPRFLGTSTSFSYTFNNDTFKKWFGKDKGKSDGNQSVDDSEQAEALPPDSGTDADNAKNEKQKTQTGVVDSDGYLRPAIPWSLSVNYTIRYGNSSTFDYDRMEYKMEFTHNLNFSGSLGLGKGWKVSATTSYDFKAKQFTYTNFNVSRNLHCWSMSGSFVPFGVYKSYTFHIGVNASMLSDLKYDKTSSESTNSHITWW